LQRYQEEVGKDFKRITLYLCAAKEFYHSETVGLDWHDASDNEDEDSADKQGGEVSSKRLKMDPVAFSSECSEASANGETEMQIQHDEEVAMELQRQLLEETMCSNPVVATGADLNVTTERSFVEEQSNIVKEHEIGTNSSENFASPTLVVQALESSSRQDKSVFYHYQEKNAIATCFKLVAV